MTSAPMASWRSSSDRSDRSTSPTSSISPLPSGTFPLWLRPPKTSNAILPPSRYKVLSAALACILLGWLMTSALSPGDRDLLTNDFDFNESATQGILDDPTTFSTYGHETVSQSNKHDGIVKPALPLGSAPKAESSDEDKTTTIKGALGELHKAVSNKLYGLTLHPSKSSNPITNSSQIVANTSSALNSSMLAGGEQVKDGLSEEDRLGARVRIGKCTILFNGNDYYERAIRSHEVHDRLHGYRLHVLRQSLLDDVWSKPAYILSLLLRELAKPESERLEWLFWVDADTIILNPYIPVETFLPPPGPDFEHIHLLYSNDWNGLNNGVFPIRVNQWAVELLSAIVAYRYYRPDGDLTFRDQSAMNTLMREPKFAKNIMEAPQRWFNAYQGEHNETLAPFQIRRGDLLVHFAGVIDREPRMTFWLDRAESHLDDWEVPLKSTSYLQEVKDFWSEQRRMRQDKHNGLSEARLSASEMLSKLDQMMNEYSERLSPEQIESIQGAQEELKSALANEEYSEDLDGLKEIETKLDAVSLPLRTAMSDVHKTLLTTAHETIFAAEKDLTNSGFYRGVSSAQIVQLDENVRHLKELVLADEDKWDRKAITDAMENVSQARESLNESTRIVEVGEDSIKEVEEGEHQQTTDEQSPSKPFAHDFPVEPGVVNVSNEEEEEQAADLVLNEEEEQAADLSG